MSEARTLAQAKRCPRCGEEDQARFYPSYLRQAGRSAFCTACSVAANRALRQTPEGRASYLAAQARYREANRERERERSRRWRRQQKAVAQCEEQSP
jgi:hypothetical protein